MLLDDGADKKAPEYQKYLTHAANQCRLFTAAAAISVFHAPHAGTRRYRFIAQRNTAHCVAVYGS